MEQNLKNKGLIKKYVISKAEGETDPKAEYFVLRLDDHGSDTKHIKACRQAVLRYAWLIRDHLPKLSQDLFAKYGAEI